MQRSAPTGQRDDLVDMPSNKGDFLSDLFGEEYKPFPGLDRSALEVKNPDYQLGPDPTYGGMTVGEFINYIPTKLSDFTFESLNNLSEQDTRLLTDFLLITSFDNIDKLFGQYMIVYIYLIAYPYGKFDGFKQYIEEKYSEEYVQFLESARYSAWRKSARKSSLKEKFLEFAIHHKMEKILYEDDVDSKYLTSKDFSFHFLHTRYGSGEGKEVEWDSTKIGSPLEVAGHYVMCYLDAPIAIGLFYKGEPVAVIAGTLEGENALCIRQMQKISSLYTNHHNITIANKAHQSLDNMPWQEALYNAMTYIVKKFNIKDISIQSAENNPWTTKFRAYPDWDERNQRKTETLSTDPHLLPLIAKQIYDIFAQKHNFKQDEKDKNRHKKL